VETIVVPNIDVVKKGVLIGSATKLGNRSNGVLVVRNLRQNSALLTSITKVVGILQIVFTNSITTTHENMTVK
jgi:hypothetical protein